MSIRAQLLRHIGRRWKPGDRLPPIRELAADLGSGYVNTHRAIRALADEGVLVARDRVGVFVAPGASVETIARRQHDAAELTPVVVRPLAGMRVHVILVDEHEPFHRRQSDAFVERMRLHRCDVSVFGMACSSASPRDLTGHDCDAIALIGYIDERGYRAQPGTAIVISYHGLVQHLPIDPPTEVDGVSVDQHHGGMIAGQCLRGAGVESVCFIGRQDKNPDDRAAPRPNRYDALSTMRLAGFEAGFGRRVPPAHQLLADWYGPGPGARVVPACLRLDPRPQAIFAATDDLALGFIHGAQAHGLEPGRDYQIVGFDGQPAGRELYEGPLTTVDIPAEEMGRRAADLLSERMLNPDQPRRQMNLGCTLFRGKTVRVPDRS